MIIMIVSQRYFCLGTTGRNADERRRIGIIRPPTATILSKKTFYYFRCLRHWFSVGGGARRRSTSRYYVHADRPLAPGTVLTAGRRHCPRVTHTHGFAFPTTHHPSPIVYDGREYRSLGVSREQPRAFLCGRQKKTRDSRKYVRGARAASTSAAAGSAR